MSWRRFSPGNLARCTLKAAEHTIITHDGIEHAGYLAFLGLLAMFPFLVFVFSIVGFLGEGEAGAQFISTLLRSMPDSVVAALKPRINEITSGPPQGLLTISILGAIWTASSAVEGLRTILNRAYHVGTPPAYWFRRTLSVLQLFVFTSLMIAGMALMLVIPLTVDYFEMIAGVDFIYERGVGSIFEYVLLGVVFLSVCFLYYLLPNIKQTLFAVVPGAAIVTMLWLGSLKLFTAYLANFDQVNLIYGSLGGIIAALLFFYICNVIFIFGAEFNYQIVQLRGKRVVQKEEAPPPVAD
ncbi:MAG: YihY/virulence factor BrkB family protein [Alphaproteobacteria bacterium]